MKLFNGNFGYMVLHQHELRGNLLQFLKDNPQSFTALGKEIKICAETVRKFLVHEQDIHYLCLLKVQNFLDKKVREQQIMMKKIFTGV